jgi:hypothetical protein
MKQDDEPMIELSVRITDGSYESRITMPADCTDEARKEFVRSWLAMQDSGLKVIQSRPQEKEKLVAGAEQK